MRCFRYRVRDGVMEKLMFTVADESEIPEGWFPGEFAAALANGSSSPSAGETPTSAPAAASTIKRGPGRPKKVIDG